MLPPFFLRDNYQKRKASRRAGESAMSNDIVFFIQNNRLLTSEHNNTLATFRVTTHFLG